MPANSKLEEYVGQDNYNKGLSIVFKSNVVTLIGNWEWDDKEPLLKFDFNATPLNFDCLITVQGTNYLIHPADLNEVISKVNALHSGQQIDYGFRIIHPDGHVKRIRGHAILLLRDLDEGKVRKKDVHVNTSSHPPLDKKKPDNASLKKFEELGVIVEATDEAIISADVKGAITYWNPAAERLFGYSREEVSGKNIKFLIPESAMEKSMMVWQKMLKGQSIHDFETQRIRKDGKIIEVMLNISPFRNELGEIVGGCAISRNVTEKKRAERILNTIDHAYLELDNALCIRYANRSAIAMLKSTAEKLKGKNFWEVLPEEKNCILYKILEEAKVQKKNLGTEYFSTAIHRWLSVSVTTAEDGLIITLYDIHAIISVREKLRENEQQLRALVDYSPDAICRISKDLKVISGNTVLENFAGKSLAEMSGEDPWKKARDPEKVPPILQKFLKVLNTGVPDEFFTDYDTALGLKHLHGRIAPEFGPDGTVNSLIVITRDITLIKKAEEKERKSLRRLRKVLDAIPHMAWISNDGYEIDFYNERWYEYTGIQPGLLRWEDAFHPAQLPEITNHWRTCLHEGKPYYAESLVRNFEGKFRWHLAIALPIKDDRDMVEMWIGTLTDIHDHLKVEKALKKSEEKFRTLVENTPEIIARWSSALRVTFVNSAITKRTGLSVGSLLDKPFTELPLPLSLKRSLKKKLKEVFHTARPADVFSKFPSENGMQHFHTQFVPELTAEGVESVLSISRDITERIKFEKELQDANEILSIRNEELKKMNEELTTLAFVASHDLREPLRKIEAFTDAILSKDYDSLSETGKDHLKRILNAIQRMNALISDILVFSKANSEEQVYMYFDLNDILMDVKHDLSEKISQTGARIESTSLPVLYGNPINFHQLLQNLISNALKFQPPRHTPVVHISATFLQGEDIDHPQAIKSATYLELTVSDNGLGFDQQYAAKIFQMFQRLHSARSFPGTGMGLAICKKMVERYHGFILAHSTPGEGSTFKCYVQKITPEPGRP